MKHILFIFAIIVTITLLTVAISLTSNMSKGEKLPVKNPSRYVLYHMGAKWCAPCVKMKKDVWSKKDVLNFLDDNDIELRLMEATDNKDMKLISFYKTRVYPTVIFIERKRHTVQLLRVEGYTGKDFVVKLLKEKINTMEN